MVSSAECNAQTYNEGLVGVVLMHNVMRYKPTEARLPNVVQPMTYMHPVWLWLWVNKDNSKVNWLETWRVAF